MEYIKRKYFPLILLFLFIPGISCTTVKYYPSNFVESLKHPTKFPDVFDFTVQNIEEVVEKNPLLEGESVKITDVGENKNSSMHLFQVRTSAEISSHYHKRHDEVVYVKKGTGIAILDGTRYMVKPGSILQIPSKTVHKIVNTGDETFMAVSIFSPPFDGRDQKFIEKQKRTDRGVKKERRLAGVKTKNREEEQELITMEVADEETMDETEKIAKMDERRKKKSAFPSYDEDNFQIKKEGINPNDYFTSKERVGSRSKKTVSAESPEVDILSLHEKLTKLLQLKNEGSLSAEEYEKKKDALIVGGNIDTLPEPQYSKKRTTSTKEDTILKEADKYAQLAEGAYDNNNQYTLPNPLDNSRNDNNKKKQFEEFGVENEQEGYEAASELENLSDDHKLKLLHEMRLEGLISEEDFQSKKKELVLKTEENSLPPSPPSPTFSTKEEKLSELKELYKEGLITEEDYRHKYDELSAEDQTSSLAVEENADNEMVRELEELYHKGLITEEDYRHKYNELTGQDNFSYDPDEEEVNNEKLSELQELMEQGIITREDYEFKKAQLTGN